MNSNLKADLVFEGGGVKGLAHVGALEVMESLGYIPNNIAGTSAGAIVAALVAVGYTAKDMLKIMWNMDFTKMKDKSGIDYIPFIGKIMSLVLEKGIFEGDYIENWMRGLLETAPLPASQFQDLKTNLKIIAADITLGKMLILPDDIAYYGIDPAKFDIALAVRMSMSIPFFFEPIELESPLGKSYIVDGGILSNYPIHIFDRKKRPRWPTFGFRLKEPGPGLHHHINGPLSMFAAIFSTMLSARDNADVLLANDVRTIDIETKNIKSTDFNLNDKDKKNLLSAGKEAANIFFDTWDFDRYVTMYRQF